MKPTLNKRKCPAQQDVCEVIRACPLGAIRYEADARERLGGRIVIDAAVCDECGQCVSECCGQAIEMQ